MADRTTTHGITREVRRRNALLRAMAKHPELCFLLVILLGIFLSNYGQSFKPKPVVIPARMPQPLFSPLSHVLDLYLGDLRPLLQMLKVEDLIFVMYYAPWCAKSHATKTQFVKAARFLEGQVKFISVNCWYPEGMCRQQYKFLLYPVFFAYHGSNDGYRFMGIHRAEFMVKFLEDLLLPLTLLGNIDHVKDFVAQHDTVVVGYFDFNSSPQPPGFQQFFYAAMRVVEHDPHQPVKFGVVTNPDLAQRCHLEKLSDLVFLRINNSSVKFPLMNNMTSSNIVQWALAYRQSLPVRWIVPLGMKSLTLSTEIDKGPAVIMFHRATPLSTASQTFMTFKDLSLRYNLCPDDGLMQDYVRRWTEISARNILEHAKALNSCQHGKKGQLIPSADFCKCCISTTTECLECMPEKKLNICEICHLRSAAQRDDPSVCSFSELNNYVSLFTQLVEGIMALPSSSCSNSISNYDMSSQTSVCCKCCQKNISFTDFLQPPFLNGPLHPECIEKKGGMNRRPTDRYVTETLERLPRKLCQRLVFQKTQEAFPCAIVPDFASSSLPLEFTGYGCKTNHTVNFITMDSQNHWMFAESLGLDVSQAHLSPVVLAFDKEHEEHLLMKESFSKKATASFILNFTKGLLKRELRSVASTRQEGCGSGPSMLCITELTTETFEAYINQPTDVVLLVYADWCGFCSAFSHTFLHLAHYFRTSPNITFARINGDTNDLSWEFSMDSYPTVILFPAHEKADSVAFPDSFELTLPNLVRFVLQHATLDTRLHLAADVCTPACIQENFDLSRHTLHALRAKLRRLQSLLSALPADHVDNSGLSAATSPDSTSDSPLTPSSDPASSSSPSSSNPSPYSLAAKRILMGRIQEIQQEIRDLKTLREYLRSLQEGGKVLDHRVLAELLSKKNMRK